MNVIISIFGWITFICVASVLILSSVIWVWSKVDKLIKYIKSLKGDKNTNK